MTGHRSPMASVKADEAAAQWREGNTGVYLPRATWLRILRNLEKSSDPTPSAVRLRDAIIASVGTRVYADDDDNDTPKEGNLWRRQ